MTLVISRVLSQPVHARTLLYRPLRDSALQLPGPGSFKSHKRNPAEYLQEPLPIPAGRQLSSKSYLLLPNELYTLEMLGGCLSPLANLLPYCYESHP